MQFCASVRMIYPFWWRMPSQQRIPSSLATTFLSLETRRDSERLGETRGDSVRAHCGMTGDTDVWLGRFSVRYDKGGSEKKFGMFGYGSSADLGRSRHAMLGIFFWEDCRHRQG